MFYDVYLDLCKKRGISPTRAAIDMGISRSTPTTWKNRGLTPKSEILEKVANYFNVSIEYLLTGEEQKEKPLVNGDEELTEYLEMLKNRSECRMLFKLAKGATKEDVEQAVKIIEALRKD